MHAMMALGTGILDGYTHSSANNWRILEDGNRDEYVFLFVSAFGSGKVSIAQL
jgi:hypothetical protein